MLRVSSPLSPEAEAIVTETVDCAFTVHRILGPGFRELIYERALRLELDSRGIAFESEKWIDVKYRQWTIPGQRIDLIVRKVVIVEVKVAPKLRTLHEAQLRSYLKTTGIRVGLLINLNSEIFKGSIRRVVV